MYFQISIITWIIGSLIMGINIYFLVYHLISVLVHGHLPLVAKIFCGVLGFSGMLIYLAGITYLVVRKNKESSHLLALTTPDSREMENTISSYDGQPRQDIVSMQLPQRRASDGNWVV